MKTQVSVNDQHAAIDGFIQKSGCFAYTSGCTMRLMGIGATQEQQADMLMCPTLRLRGRGGGFVSPKHIASRAHADVFVTHSLPSSVHILTCDFLLHSAPCLIDFSGLRLSLSMPTGATLLAQRASHMHPLEQSGGAFVINIEVGGEMFRCTMDTGAPGAVCLGAPAAKRLRHCARGAGARAIRQSGVNGENVCSEVLSSTVRFAGEEFADVPILANSHAVEMVDGYVGLGFLRGFNILIAPTGIGFKRNRLPLQAMSAYDTVAHVGGCSLQLRCDESA